MGVAHLVSFLPLVLAGRLLSGLQFSTFYFLVRIWPLKMDLGFAKIDPFQSNNFADGQEWVSALQFPRRRFTSQRSPLQT